MQRSARGNLVNTTVVIDVFNLIFCLPETKLGDRSETGRV